MSHRLGRNLIPGRGAMCSRRWEDEVHRLKSGEKTQSGKSLMLTKVESTRCHSLNLVETVKSRLCPHLRAQMCFFVAFCLNIYL